MARLNEQLQQEASHKEHELKETREAHQTEINTLQENITTLVSHKKYVLMYILSTYVELAFSMHTSIFRNAHSIFISLTTKHLI